MNAINVILDDDLWDDFSDKLNLLSDKMKKADIEVSMLYDVLKARDKVKNPKLLQESQNS